jgi:outer membrane PBP1 activator LpoA protein
LFALGGDAFRITARWGAFIAGYSPQMSGMTGTLVLDNRTHQVHRHLFCSQFVNGQPKNVGESLPFRIK